MSQRCGPRQLVAAGGLAVVLLLPLVFDPWAALPFEPIKVRLFRVVTIVMLVASMAAAVACRLETATSQPGQPASGFRWSSSRLRRIETPALTVPILLYVAALALATAFSVDPRLSFWGPPGSRHGALTILCAGIFSLLLANALTTRQQVERLTLALVLSSVPVAVYGLAQAAGLDPLRWTTDSVSPVLSTLGRSNFLGAYLAVIIPFTMARLVVTAPAKKQAWGYAIVLAMQVACLILTLARAALLAALAGSLVLLGLLARRRRSWRLAAILIVVLVVGSAWSVVMETLSPLPAAPPASQPAAPAFVELRAASVAARGVIWQAALRLIPARWLLGYGPETFASVFMAHYPASLAQYQAPAVVVDDAHNLALDALMASGLLGLLALLAVVLGFYGLALRAWRQARDSFWQVTTAAILAGMTAWLVQAQFNPQVIVLVMLFWLLLALAAASSRLVV